jgi:hypothetical protein
MLFELRQLTEARAEWTSQAIERYYARESRYPQDLRQLPGISSRAPGR